MRRRLTGILVPLALLVLVSAAVVVVNQSLQLVALADRLHPVAGDAVLWILVVLFGVCLAVPLVIYATLPAALVPPEAAAGPEYEKHLQRLRKRLARNPNVTGAPVELQEVEAALAQLDALAVARTKAAALKVFMTTAISQNGSLDALLVLAAQSRLVLEIARIYYQRPTLRDLTYLYSNVAATALIAAELEDIDLSEQTQPIVTAVLGSSVGAIPGLSAAAGLFVSSVTTGAGNAYLTLRVGILARQYCRALVRPERRSLRRAAAVEAARLLGTIVREGAASRAAVIFSKPRKYFAEMINAAAARASSMFRGKGPEGEIGRP